MLKNMVLSVIVILAVPMTASAQYTDWNHVGSIYVLTTPESADLPASAVEAGFPLLVRLHGDFFNFSQARDHGEDIRFSTNDGAPLAYQIEQWDPAKGTASLWVLMPTLKGNAQQEIKLYWGKADAPSESSGSAVFNESNGYLSVWHMNGPVKDEVGTLESKDVGTTAAEGVIGSARHLAGKQGILCGDKIADYPVGAGAHSSEAWFRADKPNTTVVGWGNEQAQGKVVMQFRSPPHVNMDCYFSDANVKSRQTLSMDQWIHVVHTYQKGDTRMYVNGALDSVSSGRATPLSIKSPARLWIGGWYNNYDFVGDIDEVRVSNVTRSEHWVKLQFENQKPLQTLVGCVVQPGDTVSVSPSIVTVPEGQKATFTAEAGGARKVYWTLKRDGRDTLVAVDRFQYTFAAGRVTGDTEATLQFKAVYANEVKTKDIPITIQEAIPEPVLTLKAPAAWDGRQTIEVVPQIDNLDAMQAAGAGTLTYTWQVSNIAVNRVVAPGKLLLKRAQNSGDMVVTVTVDNGGQPFTQTTTIKVTEPQKDTWAQRTPTQNEKPVDNQFYARNDKNQGMLHYNGTLDREADNVFLKVTADNALYEEQSLTLPADRTYAFAVKLMPGLVKYRVEFGATQGDQETVLHTVNNLVCGDAYLIDGQSNAEATDIGPEDPAFSSDWIRSFGSMAGHPEGARTILWGNAAYRDRNGGKLQIGYWGMELARILVENQQIPICIINGAVGGTRIDQHQRNGQDPEDVTTIYGRLLWRVRQAGVTHGIRGILWHQGENDQGADGPTGRFGWETYHDYFVDMSAAWKEDYPNIRQYYLFQIWPRACSMGIDGSDNMMREVQRTLPSLFSNMSVMSTLGIKPPGGCHYPPEGYAQIAKLIAPLVEQNNYQITFPQAVTAPNLTSARYTNDQHNEIALAFNQPMAWSNALTSEFYLDGRADHVASGSAHANVITLKLKTASTAEKITYLDSRSWSADNLLYGENHIAALTFCDVPISDNER